MRKTGLKILYFQIRSIIKFPSLNLSPLPKIFPQKGLPHWKMRLWLYSLLNEIREIKLTDKIGASHSTPARLAVNVWNKILPLNPNNLGNLYPHKNRDLIGTPKSEHDLIEQLVNLLGGKVGRWAGYVTSGATESNIFSAWVGRNYLKEVTKNKRVIIIVNNLTHYSILKAADILNIKTEITAIDDNWVMNSDSLVKKIKNLYKKGYRAFLLPLTLGYTQTGTNDNYQDITAKLSHLENSMNAKFFVWIDAATNGLILPFTTKNFYTLKNNSIKAIAIDFHKAGMNPIPSGIVIYDLSFKKFISRQIPYIESDDLTLLGSRPGASAAGMLAVINSMGFTGFKKKIRERLKLKNMFIKKVSQILPDIKIINSPNSISLGLVSNKKIPKIYSLKYGLFSRKVLYKFTDKTRAHYIYKAFF